MIQRFRQRIPWLRGQRVEADPQVKVAGAPTRQEADTCLETLLSQGIRAEVRQDLEGGGFELWAPASQEPQARLLLGLSGRGVIRLPRQRPVEKGKR
ncbi:MAG: hypothetical protein ACE5KW_05010 [Dehalococcoidia bacterium]